MNRSDVINDGNDNLERNNLNSLNYWQIINFMHFLDDSSVRDGQSKGIDLIDESGEDNHSSVLSQGGQRSIDLIDESGEDNHDNHSSVLSQDGQRSIDLIDESGEDSVLFLNGQNINLDGSGEDGPSSSFQSTFFFVSTLFLI